MFKIDDSKNGLRRGEIKTAHGNLATPFFMPDATRGFVKLLTEEELKSTKTPAMVVNTFHLYLQPGPDLIKKTKGIHKFMDCSRPLLSDSGGFQVFSLIHRSSNMGSINDDRVIFKSPIDGSRHELTPERSIQIQFDLGVDMMVCLDDCPPNEFSRLDLERAVNRTIDWAKRCKLEYLKQIKTRKLSGAKRPLLFCVVQGGAELDLREKCARKLALIGFDGYGFGARPIDKDGNFLAEVMFKTASYIPQEAIRFALGVGTPDDIYRSYMMGWDMFDCVIPTREGRHGRLFNFTPKFKGFKKPKDLNQPITEAPEFYTTLNISNAEFTADFSPINAKSKIPELRNHTKAYLHHLFKVNEPLGQKLASLNNLEFFADLMESLKKIK
ncbi:MAG: tRNA guanosine(34) transglycosylase Tgt [Candidatus Falkowbacteria bacterium]